METSVGVWQIVGERCTALRAAETTTKIGKPIQQRSLSVNTSRHQSTLDGTSRVATGRNGSQRVATGRNGSQRVATGTPGQSPLDALCSSKRSWWNSLGWSSTDLLQLTEVERFHIKDRGDIIVVELSPEWLDHNDPRSLTDTTVEIDGVKVKVSAVETFCTPWYPNQGNTSPHRHVGLLVRDKRK